ncbi:MAG: tetratricopeptide repeat protein [Thermoguttaceae bacterium]
MANAARPAPGWRTNPCQVFGAAGLAALCLAAAGCGSFAARGLNAEGVRLFDQARYQEALQQFQRAADSDPANADALYNLGAVYHRIGTLYGRPADLAQAEQYYNLCLGRNPDHPECYRGLAVLLAQQGRVEEAVRRLQSWADSNPGSPEPKIELARLSEEFGQPQQARQYLAEALLADPSNARALAALGRLSEQAGDPVRALQNYQQSLYADRFQPEVASRVAALQSAVGAGLGAGSPEAAALVAPRPAGAVR